MPRNFDQDAYNERKQEELDDDLIGHLASDDKGLQRFSEYLANLDKPADIAVVDKLIREWLKTPDGKSWYQKMFEYLSEAPEPPDTDD